MCLGVGEWLLVFNLIWNASDGLLTSKSHEEKRLASPFPSQELRHPQKTRHRLRPQEKIAQFGAERKPSLVRTNERTDFCRVALNWNNLMDDKAHLNIADLKGERQTRKFRRIFSRLFRETTWVCFRCSMWDGVSVGSSMAHQIVSLSFSQT